jgi:hypothetical protein
MLAGGRLMSLNVTAAGGRCVFETREGGEMMRTAPRRLASGLALAGSMLLLTGCLSVSTPAAGILFTDVYGPVDAGEKVGTKEGTACARSFLGLVARGDASVKAAARAGGITRIDTVDYHSTSLLSIVTEFCTIVRGS